MSILKLYVLNYIIASSCSLPLPLFCLVRLAHVVRLQPAASSVYDLINTRQWLQIRSSKMPSGDTVLDSVERELRNLPLSRISLCHCRNNVLCPAQLPY